MLIAADLAPATPICPAALAGAALAARRQPAAGGWYDSSLDLLTGLEVNELGPVERLDAWLAALTGTADAAH